MVLSATWSIAKSGGGSNEDRPSGGAAKTGEAASDAVRKRENNEDMIRMGKQPCCHAVGWYEDDDGGLVTRATCALACLSRR